MKLYATTTSERASKGQGGEYLEIDITNDKKEQLAYISVKIIDKKPVIRIYWNLDKIDEPDLTGEYLDEAINISRTTKGKSQKGEIARQLKEDREKDTFNSGMQ